MPGVDHPVELQNLCLQYPQLDTESRQTRAGNLGQPLVICVRDDAKQLLDTVAADRCDDAKLREVSPDGIDHRRLLPDEQMACAMEYQATLLPRCLDRDEAHVHPGDCLANGLRISRIVFVPFDIGLHVGRWHQTHGMAKHLELAPPMMRRGTSLNPNKACWQPLEERKDLATLQLPADHHLAGSIDAMNLKDRFGDIETDCRNRLHGWFLLIVGALLAPTSVAPSCRWRSRPQHRERTFITLALCRKRAGSTYRVHLPTPERSERS